MVESAENKALPAKTASRKSVWILSAVIAVLAVLLIRSTFSSALIEIETTLADEHARELEMLRDHALASTNATEIVDTLRYMAIYYAPSDLEAFKSRSESLLRRVRRGVIRDVIGHLRKLTGRDLGENPAAWVAEYAPPEK